MEKIDILDISLSTGQTIEVSTWRHGSEYFEARPIISANRVSINLVYLGKKSKKYSKA